MLVQLLTIKLIHHQHFLVNAIFVLKYCFLPYQFYLMLPYLLSIVAMVIMARRARYPKALLVPYRRGERV